MGNSWDIRNAFHMSFLHDVLAPLLSGQSGPPCTILRQALEGTRDDFNGNTLIFIATFAAFLGNSEALDVILKFPPKKDDNPHTLPDIEFNNGALALVAYLGGKNEVFQMIYARMSEDTRARLFPGLLHASLWRDDFAFFERLVKDCLDRAEEFLPESRLLGQAQRAKEWLAHARGQTQPGSSTDKTKTTGRGRAAEDRAKPTTARGRAATAK
jgi:hypothetical protein